MAKQKSKSKDPIWDELQEVVEQKRPELLKQKGVIDVSAIYEDRGPCKERRYVVHVFVGDEPAKVRASGKAGRRSKGAKPMKRRLWLPRHRRYATVRVIDVRAKKLTPTERQSLSVPRARAIAAAEAPSTAFDVQSVLEVSGVGRGTLGLVVTVRENQQDVQAIITCAHVVERFNQPDPLTTVRLNTSSGEEVDIVRMGDVNPNDVVREHDVDIALIRFRPELAGLAQFLTGIEWPNDDSEPNQSWTSNQTGVVKNGDSLLHLYLNPGLSPNPRKLRRGKLFNARGPFIPGQGNPTMDGQILIASRDSEPFAQPGDSGAPLIRLTKPNDPSTARVVGIIIGVTASKLGVATPITRIRDLLKCKLF